MAADHAPKPNAFLHPTNPLAVFPQIKKPEIIDLRVNRMKHGGLVATGTFRKHLSKNAQRSEYATIVKTPAELAAEEQESDDEQMQVAASSKYTVDDLTAMAANLKIGKKPKQKQVDAEMPKISDKSKGIQKKQCKRLKKQLGF